jgi:HEAT repeat protein
MELDQLVKELSAAIPAERTAAAEELARLGESAQLAAVPLVRAMGDEDGTVRDWGLAALESLGPPRAEDTVELVVLLADAKLNIAYWAATLLGRLGADADATKVVPALVEAFTSHPDLAVRERAAWALGRIGRAASAALPALRTAAGDSKLRLSRLAGEAIAKIE